VSVRIPKYCRHRNGQAYIYHKSIDRPGHRLYLGVHGSEDSRRRYREFVDQLQEQQEDNSEALRAKTRLKTPCFRDHFNTSGYRQSIHYAVQCAQKAGVEVEMWNPNQLRYSIVTSVSKDIDDYAAQRWLGHKNLATTNTYIAKQVAELISIAREFDRRWAV